MIVGSLVPLAILLSLLAMGALNIPLQRMSIAAIIISLGLLVDNGIVIAEDIKRRLGLGEGRRDAAIRRWKRLLDRNDGRLISPAE